MGTYSTRAKGLWVDANDEVTVADLAAYDFLIAKVGPKFHANVQHAYDAKKPLIMFYVFRPEIWAGTSLAYSKWPADQNVCLNECRQWIMSGSSQRAIHGIMVDGSEFANKQDVFWLTMPLRNFMEVLWNEFKLPNYLFMNRVPITTFSGSQAGKEALYGLANDMDGISTTTWASVDVNNIPLDSAKPVMDYNNSKTWFWLYKIMGNRILCNYLMGNKAQLYSDLSYTAVITDPIVPPVDPGTPPVTPPTNGLTDSQKIEWIYSKLAEIFK